MKSLSLLLAILHSVDLGLGRGSRLIQRPLLLDWNHIQSYPTSALKELPGDERLISRDPSTVGFYLYPDQRDWSSSDQLLLGNTDSVQRSRFDPKLPVILLIHGFVTSYKDDFVQSIKNAYLEARFGANIIGVDWGKMSTPTGPTPYLYYNLATRNVPLVGERVARFILFLLEVGVVRSPDEVHIVGFSLGAHVAGIAGLRLIQSRSGPVQRITGLDPAAPLFQLKPNAEKLDRTDARFVDIVHTNQGLKGYLGLLGHVDFFPNSGGPSQPGCTNVSDFSDLVTGSCSHARSYKYFAASIRDPTILACKCVGGLGVKIKYWDFDETRTFVDPSCKTRCLEPVPFGQNCPQTARGIYYLSISVRS